MLITELDSVNELPEALREHYVKDEESGKWVLDAKAADGSWAIKDFSKLKATLVAERSKTRGRVQELEKELKDRAEAFKQYEGLDPVEARDALEKVAQGLADGSASKGKWEDRERQLNEKWAKDFSAKQKEIESKFVKDLESKSAEAKDLMEQLHGQIVRSTAIQALSGKTDHVNVLLPHVLSRMTMQKNEAGKFIPVVLDASGNPDSVVKDGVLVPKSGDDLITEMRNGEFAPFFRGSGASGGGSVGSQVGATGGRGGRTVHANNGYITGVDPEEIVQGKVGVSV